MATSPSFNWPEPDNTDLVKNGALAIRTAVDAIDTSMTDLLGGTTGQVLAKASDTNMDFSWVAQDDSNAIQNAIVDAKGDLISATAADTPARLAVGTNGQVLTADSSTATGLKWAAASGGSFATGYNHVATSQSTTSTSFTGLTTAGAVTVTTGTKALVSISATVENAAGVNVLGLMGFAISGATTVSASDQYSAGINFLATGGGNFQVKLSGTFVITGLTAGSNTFTTQFRKGAGDTPGFANRTISVVDLGS
jgi:hypothetical protein